MLEQILKDGFLEYGIPAGERTLRLFRDYYAFLSEKNKVMDLTAITGEDETGRMHFLDSCALLKHQDFEGKKAVDVGSGAGFPGLPLVMAGPEMDMTLLESQQKRADFLEETIARLDLRGVRCLCLRAEEAAHLRETFDIAVSRAVAKLNVLCELCLPLVRPGGAFLAMKGPDAGSELEEARSGIALLGGGGVSVLRYDIPGTDVSHCLVRIEKVSHTPAQYPRRFARIKRLPLG